MVLNYSSYDHNESTRVQLPEAAGILMGGMGVYGFGFAGGTGPFPSERLKKKIMPQN